MTYGQLRIWPAYVIRLYQDLLQLLVLGPTALPWLGVNDKRGYVVHSLARKHAVSLCLDILPIPASSIDNRHLVLRVPRPLKQRLGELET